MVKILVEVSPTSYRFRVTPSGIVVGTNVSIYRHCFDFNEREWNSRARVMEIKKQYRFYDRKTQMLFLPRYDLDRFLHLLDDNGVEYTIVEVALCLGKSVDIPVVPNFKPRSEIQAEAIDYCVNDPHPLRAVAMQPGAGKSACALVSAARIGHRFMIKTPILLAQWKGAIHQFLQVSEDDIYMLSGSGTVMRLLEEIDKTLFPKIILASLQTLRDYANAVEVYQHFPPFVDFINRINVGTVVSDEVHMHFHAALITDMLMNPAVMIPMSATPEVTSQEVEPIFDGHFPKSRWFGLDRYKKYVDVTSYTYTIPLSQIPRNQYKLMRGYSHSKYEEDLLKKRPMLDKLVNNVYYPILYAEYFNYALPGEKLLIICVRTEMCAYLAKRMERDFPDKKVGVFISGSPERVKTDNDIVISTVKSSGVGFDMPNLITTFVTVAADSPPLNKQLLGRLRELAGRSPRLAYASCLTIQAHIKYMNTRRRIFPSLAKSFNHHALL